MQVPSGFDVADQRIVMEVAAGDLLITADIALALEVIAKGACVLDPRGELLDARNIEERLTLRNFKQELRSEGIEIGGPPSFAAADRQAFANRLEKLLLLRTRTRT